MDAYNQLLNIMVIGDPGVGKTSLIFRIAKDIFLEDLPSDDPAQTTYRHLDNQIFKMHMWDAWICKRYHPIAEIHKHLKTADIVFLVYNIADLDTFTYLRDQKIEEYGPKRKFMLVGNQIDREERAVTYEQGAEFARRCGISFIETSAKTGENVELMLTTAIRQWSDQKIRA